MTRLAAVLTERGLRMRPQRNRAAAPISAKYLTLVLRDRYYLGTVTYKGEEFAGRHEALVTPELFARVQAVLDGRLAKTGERQRKTSSLPQEHPVVRALPRAWAGAATSVGSSRAAFSPEHRGTAASTGISCARRGKTGRVVPPTCGSRMRKRQCCSIT